MGQWTIGKGWEKLPRKPLTVGIVCFALAVVAGLWASVEVLIAHERKAKIEHVMQQNANLARAFEEHTIQTLRYIDENLLILKRRFESDGENFDLPSFWNDNQINLAIARNAAITDATGTVVLGSLPSPRISLADREHINVHFNADSGRMFIGKPVEARINKSWSIVVSRRANKPDGSLLGVVSIAVNPFYFSDFYKDIDLGAHGTVALVGTDGIIRARLGGDESRGIGLDVSKGDLSRQISKVPNGAYVAKSVSDGITRIFAYRTVRDYPLYVTVGSSLGEALADVDNQAHVYRILAVVISLGVVAFAAYLLQSTARLEQLVGQRTRDLRVSEMRLAGILSIAPEAIVVVDEGGEIRLFNSGAEKIFGYEAAEAIGQPLDILIPERHRARHPDLVRAFGDGLEQSRKTSTRGRIAGLRRDGREFPAEASIAKLDLDDGRLFIVILHDATESVAQERSLIIAKEDAEFASRAKSEFLANMSHELRTPLNAIIGFSEMMSLQQFGPLGNARYEGYAQDIVSSGRHLLSVINDVLDVAKIEARQMQLIECALDLGQVSEECLGFIQPMADEKGITVTLDVTRGMPRVRADERRMRQVALNLLSNAVKFTPRGGAVTVRIAREADGTPTLTIVDTGIGIPADRLRYIGQPFVRAEDQLNRNSEGTGLGLALSNALVVLHGGTLTIASEVGRGTTVTVRLPVERVVAETNSETVA